MRLHRLHVLAVFQFMLLAALGADSFPPVAELPLRDATPDPLVMLDGTPVTTKKEWFTKRRPELKGLFQHYMYGWFPPPVKVRGKITYTDKNFFNGKATLQLATLTLGKAPAPEIHLLMVIPNHRRHPAPVFLGMNFSGNHTLVTDPNVPLTPGWMPSNFPHASVVNNRSTEGGRGRETNTWALEQSIDRGYAVVTYYCGDVEQDRNNAQDGVRELIHVPRVPDDWGTIAAWAWGMQRVVDYLTTDRDIDKNRIAMVGQSRFGKAALLAGAFDDRVALIIPWQAGCAGTSPSRGRVSETVKQINTNLPRWLNSVFKEFNEQPERLPFDQNCLIALCAPRPVLDGEGAKDTVSTPLGAFRMVQAADGAYGLTGTEGLAAVTRPATNQLIDSNLGFYLGPGKHSPMTPHDWKICLDFADRHLARPGPR